MIHKYPGSLPTVGFAWQYLRQYSGQRATFQLAPTWRLYDTLANSNQFDTARPIMVNAIFCGLRKKPPGWPATDWSFNRARTPPSAHEFHFVFRDVTFQQDQKTAWLLTITRKQNKQHNWEFKFQDMVGWDVPALRNIKLLGSMLAGNN